MVSKPKIHCLIPIWDNHREEVEEILEFLHNQLQDKCNNKHTKPALYHAVVAAEAGRKAAQLGAI